MTDETLSVPPGFARELTQLIDAIETFRVALTEEETLTTVENVTVRRRLFLALYPLKTIRRQLADSEGVLSHADRDVVTWDDSDEALYHIQLRLGRLLEDLSIEGYDRSSQEYSIEQTLEIIRDHIVILQDALSEGPTDDSTLPEQLSSHRSAYADVAGRGIGDGRWLEYQLHRALKRWGYQAETRQRLFGLEVDVVAVRKPKQQQPTDWIVAQCKDWTSDTITPSTIFRLCTIAFACRAMPVLCHTTEITSNAKELARRFEVRVLDLTDLERAALPGPQVYKPTAELHTWPPHYGARDDRGTLPVMFYGEPGKRFSYVPGFRPVGMESDYKPIDDDRDDDTHPAAGH
ncbi:restriction endonuclease [Halorubrum sp. DM2]|uniref:restriction endonuclease n=1 Tax=Halorubrum sp. DM2 TaxID=2527867 RepID=UPI0024B7F585|nr:restriction endonuclease [Halorubrum sp. DM2]